MWRAASLILTLACAICADLRAEQPVPEWHLVYTPNHRAAFEQAWICHFPNYLSRRWIIALRYPPELPWSRQAEGTAELLTSAGWKAFVEKREQSKEHRRVLVIDCVHDDPMLRHGFTVRTTLTATICDQHLQEGASRWPVPPLLPPLRDVYLAATSTFDFRKPIVKDWMDSHEMWKRPNESPLDFVHRVYRRLRMHLRYSKDEGGPWTCSQILKVGFGECCRHAIVGTSILRANGIPARTVCGLWAIDARSQGAHCWGEFYLKGVGWVPYDTTYDWTNTSDVYFGNKTGEVLAGAIDFDWVINAGPFGKKTLFAMDAFPAYWSLGTGSLDNPKVETKTRAWVVKDAP